MVVMVLEGGTQTWVTPEGIHALVGYRTKSPYTLANGVLMRTVYIRRGRALTEKQARHILGEDILEEEYQRLAAR